MLDKPYVQLWDPPPAPFESVTAMGGTRECTIGEAEPAEVRCARVDANFLRVLGVHVAEGRDFTPEDDVRGAPLVAVISHALWRSRYGADPAAVGRTLSLDSTNAPVQRVPIVGVLPADFEMPIGTADILLPMQMRPLDMKQPFMTFPDGFARLKRDVTAQRAALMLAPQLPEVLQFMSPAGRATWSARATWRVRPLRDRRVGDAARVAWLLIGAVAVFLLIACVNVANLMLARVAERQREFAIRAAVGAGKMRLARLALAESMLLALAAGGIGLLLAFALLSTFVAMAPAGLPGIAEASIDLRVFVVADRADRAHRSRHWRVAGRLRLPRRRLAGAALDGHLVARCQAARPVRAGHDPDRADAGAARRLRPAAAKSLERRHHPARLRGRARGDALGRTECDEVSDSRAPVGVLRRAPRPRRRDAWHRRCGLE